MTEGSTWVVSPIVAYKAAAAHSSLTLSRAQAQNLASKSLPSRSWALGLGGEGAEVEE